MVTIKIEYCTHWHYTDRAVSLTADLLKEFEPHIAALELVPSSGGVFEVDVDGTLIFSKRALGRHAHAGEVAGLLRPRLEADAAAPD